MYLNVNSMLIILLYQCLTIWTNISGFSINEPIESGFDGSNSFSSNTDETSKSNENRQVSRAQKLIHKLGIEKNYDPNDCHILAAEKDYNMPVPFFFHTKPPVMISPDHNGIINIKHGEFFKFSCVDNEFLWPYEHLRREVTVKCLFDNYIEYQNKTHLFEEFRCVNLPTSKLVSTSRKCQNLNHSSVLRVGFQTERSFLNLYRICFDMKHLNPVYSWYQIVGPKFIHVQSTAALNKVTNNEFQHKMFGNISIPEVYKNQAKTVGKIIKSEEMMKFYIVKLKDEVRYFVPSQMITYEEFSFYFQQRATFYYENTIPTWYKFQINIYKQINEEVQLMLAQEPAQRLLVVTGTHDTFSLLNDKAQLQMLYLYLPNSIKIPKFYWKMVYNYNTKKGIVFIGLNTAFTTHVPEKRMCQSSMCPGFRSQEDYDNAFVFCCTKESFEDAYGQLDPQVYQKF